MNKLRSRYVTRRTGCIMSGIDLDFVCKGSENIGCRQVNCGNVHVFVQTSTDNVAVARILYRYSIWCKV